jgi:predicted transcriptional regulator
MLQEINGLMMLEIRAPFSSSLNSSSPSTRDALVSIVGFQPGLSCAQLTKIVRKTRKADISQQAIFKLLNQLVEEGVIQKTERRYALNQTWITQAKKFLTQIEERTAKAETSPLILI